MNGNEREGKQECFLDIWPDEMMVPFIKMMKSVGEAGLFYFLTLYGEEKTWSQEFYFKLDKLKTSVKISSGNVKWIVLYTNRDDFQRGSEDYMYIIILLLSVEH